MSWEPGGRLLALFSANDAIVAVAIVSALATILAPVAVLLVKSLIRIREAAEQAVHNTQSNGVEGTPPSAYDVLVASHAQLTADNEYIIGLVHGAQKEARDAAAAAARAREAARENEKKADVLYKAVGAGFQDAKRERAILRRALDANVRQLEQTETSGEEFVRIVALGTIPILERLDALDGRNSAAELRERLIAAGILPGGDATPPSGTRAILDPPPDGE